ncbi:uncharacterized protein KY384_003161 [Bacidia gigantensis]|uniref:uncharacterized protein n=1 Tax=Bacidia gigantensis TaxID=2732470 RepID=UPI001D03C4C0|nr:uncharacterized protein KY384_003161 [Bacidia gigantensis]KAG8531532.1 hypothetical protein KY384_003161 [Bacidia gigantensis]
MAETCIVCLGDLGENSNDSVRLLPRAIKSPADGGPVPRISTSPSRSDENKNELIAHLLPCGHDLHNECLKPWVERANSCPICRQSFNQVELMAEVGGESISILRASRPKRSTLGSIISSYAVEDKTQVADVDPSMIIDEIYDEPEDAPCPVCREDDNEDVLLACDGCDAYYHTYCVGLDSVPIGHWFCENCETQRIIESVCPPSSERPPQRPQNSSDRRTRAQQRRLRSRNQVTSSSWARVWQSVWDHLNIDLDFPFDEDSDARRIDASHRTASQRREFHEWEARLQVAERQGGPNRFRDTASALLDLHARREQPPQPEPESQEELRAWNAFEKAREIEAAPSPKRKRKSATTSPSEPEPAQQMDRPLKRPRTRRVVENSAASPSMISDPLMSSAAGPSSRLAQSSAAQSSGPTLVQSMLQKIEASNNPNESLGQSRLSIQAGANSSSPLPSSPRVSPTTSNHASPRARSTTPPPSTSPRPSSPLSLTSKIEPIFPPADFSPERSPSDNTLAHRSRPEQRRQSRQLQQDSSPSRSADASPSRVNVPFAMKADLQKMVSNALKPHYQSNTVSKDQYTDINRNVSRMLYDKVGEQGNVDGDERKTYERLATDEVAKAVEVLTSGSRTSD